MNKTLERSRAGNFPARWLAELFSKKLRRLVGAVRAALILWADLACPGLFNRGVEMAAEAEFTDLQTDYGDYGWFGNGATFGGLRFTCSGRDFFRWTGVRLRARGRFWSSLEVVALDNCSGLSSNKYKQHVQTYEKAK